MPIFNYSTTIPWDKSVLEIQHMLSRAGATAVLQEFESGITSHISFKINTPHGLMAFRLPANLDKVYAILNKQKGVEPRYRTKDHAARVGWRIIKDWVKAQLAIIETEMVTLSQVFLPYAQNGQGETVYQQFERQGFPQLTHKKD